MRCRVLPDETCGGMVHATRTTKGARIRRVLTPDVRKEKLAVADAVEDGTPHVIIANEEEAKTMDEEGKPTPTTMTFMPNLCRKALQ